MKILKAAPNVLAVIPNMNFIVVEFCMVAFRLDEEYSYDRRRRRRRRRRGGGGLDYTKQ